MKLIRLQPMSVFFAKLASFAKPSEILRDFYQSATSLLGQKPQLCAKVNIFRDHDLETIQGSVDSQFGETFGATNQIGHDKTGLRPKEVPCHHWPGQESRGLSQETNNLHAGGRG